MPRSPKVNRHAEVKPSKFKTTYCQFYQKGEVCPFGAKCAFAHGEHELKKEEDNVYLLTVTGLPRLEALYRSPAPRSPVTPTTRRRPVMVSLPKHSAAAEPAQVSPYEATTPTFNHNEESVLLGKKGFVYTQQHTNCRRAQSLVYRHDPYRLQ
ncbi:hypothetical protein AGDE_06977 [Angomonas deanei]|nr:hypothetical protein AGDE_06977 [Angomonas deanei]|eukprot:EPY36310.1 hypothetical protein AGDE_06977 [Angomonas deanei]